MSRLRRCLVACLLVVAGACSDEPRADADSAGGGRGRPGAAAKAKAAGPAEAGSAGATTSADTLVFRDEDFVESEHNRDPFRSYVAAFRSRGPDAVGGDPQRPVIMPTTAVESMKLIAVISGLPRPKAMLVDSLGVGYVVERGDYVGRAKTVQAAGNVQMVLNWRVDRIREDEVVLTRQDAADPTHAPTTHIISMTDAK